MSRVHVYYGNTYLDIGKYSEAEKSFITAREIREKILPSYHPSIAYAWDGIAYTYMEMENEN
jgi:hypothetical protein